MAADPLASPFIVDSWGVEDGLPDSEAISVWQAKDGYLWIGTLHGLVRFDGNQFTVFNEMNTPGLPSDSIVFLYEDSHTNLWIGPPLRPGCHPKTGNKSFEKETAGIGAVTCCRRRFQRRLVLFWKMDFAGVIRTATWNIFRASVRFNCTFWLLI